jgi:hypothetical protein
MASPALPGCIKGVNGMADENEVIGQYTEQNSPAVEDNVQPDVEDTDTGVNLEETPVEDTEGTEPETDDKNWRAVRQQLEELKAENSRLRENAPRAEPKIEQAKESQVVNPFLTTQDQVSLQMNEMKALTKFDSLDPDSESYDELFDIAVSGEYRAELDKYAKGLMVGQRTKLPSAYDVARKVKKQYDSKFAARQESLQQAKKQSVESKQATVAAEGRSDKRQPQGEQLEDLKAKSQRGDYDAIAERIARSGL